MAMLERMGTVLFGLGADATDDAETRQKKGLLLATCVLILPAAIVWGSLYLAFREPAAALLPYAYFAISIVTIAAFIVTRSFALLRRVQLLNILIIPAVLCTVLGGLGPSGAVVLWSLLAPLGAIVFGEPRRAWRWFLAFLAGVVGSQLAAAALGTTSALPEALVLSFLVMNIAAMSAVAFVLLLTYALQRQGALAQLRVEQEKGEALLLNVLPDRIAQLLKTETRTVADQFESASILFADVVDFTPLSSRLGAADVVDLLDHLFSHFDALADRHGLEKIKTIGDCYMVAAGVPTPRPDHAQAMARMALDMRDAMTTHPELAALRLELRIGINSGPVIAGVIGRKRFIYDLWGDAVNTASRMESHGAPGQIQITRATYELIKDDFICERRGTVPVKGKGEMETWFLVAAREPDRVADESAAPREHPLVVAPAPGAVAPDAPLA